MNQKTATALWLLVCVLMSLIAFPLYGYAETNVPSRTVRVGCSGIRSFIEVSDNNNATGYGVTYLEAIAEKTGWKYSYVCGGSWSECVEMLKRGEIDVLLPAEKSAVKQTDFLLSERQCHVDYVGIYTRKDKEGLYYNDYESFQGMRVGLIRENGLNDYFFQVAEEKNLDFIPVYYDREDEVEAALEAGKVDAVVSGNLEPSSDKQVLSQLELVPAYFMMNRSNEDLMEQLDEAMNSILLENPYFEAGLYRQYYGSFEQMAKGWTREEAEFIKTCPPLRVICDADNNPVGWLDRKTGEYKGIYIEILKLIAEESGLTFEFVFPKDVTEPWKAVQNGEGDLLSAAYGNEALEKAYHMCFTTPYYPEQNAIIGRRGGTFDLEKPMKIALLDSFISTQYYIKEAHPNWEIVFGENWEDCMRMVEDGEADITMTDTITLPYSDYLGQFPALDVVSTLSMEIPMGIGISKERDFNYELLQSVLNKATLRISEEKVNSYVLGYTIERVGQVGFADLLRRHPEQFFIGIVIFLLAIFLGGILEYGNKLKTMQNIELEKKNVQLSCAVQEAEHTRDLYDALYNMAVCGIAQFEVRGNGHTTMFHANNEAKAILTGKLEADQKSLFETDLRHRVYGQDRKIVHRAFCALKKIGDKDSVEFRVTRSDKRIIWIRTTIEVIDMTEQQSKIVQSTFMDITENKEMEKRLKDQSERDSLTGLYNKGAMEQYSRAYLTDHSRQTCAYCIVDIDNFKEINDSWGHWNGDSVLKDAGQAIRSVTRGKGFIGRFGGDELVVFFQNIKQEDAERQAQVICSKIAQITILQNPGMVSASIGVAVGTGSTYEELFEKADQALYEAKLAGKGCVRIAE